MPESVNATLGANVLAFNDIGSSKEEVLSHVQNLNEYVRLDREELVKFNISEQSFCFLCENNLLPTHDNIKKILKKFEIIEIDANTVLSRIQPLLTAFNDSAFFERVYNIEEIEFKKFAINPDVFEENDPDGLREELARNIVLVALLQKYGSEFEDTSCFVLKCASNNTYRIQASLHSIQNYRSDMPSDSDLPMEMKFDLIARGSFHELIQFIDEKDLLIKAENNSDVEKAIRIGNFKHQFKDKAKNIETLDWSAESIPIVGRDFRENSQRCCANADGSLPAKIIRSIVETINEQNLKKVHKLRTGKGGDNPHRTRTEDGAKAWRRDIDREYHLHYWECQNGRVELANVGVHDNFKITH